MGQSRGNSKVKLPGGFKRQRCLESTKDFMVIKCENSGRVNNNKEMEQQDGQDLTI